MGSVVAFFNNFISIITSVLGWVLTGMAQILLDMLYILLDGFLTVITGFMQGINIGQVLVNTTANWGLLPPLGQWFLAQLGIGTIMSMLAAALTTRLILNVVPSVFTRI